MGNGLKTAVLLGALTGLLVGLAYVIGGSGFALIALVFAGVMNFVAYWFSDKLALSMAGAKRSLRRKSRTSTRWSRKLRRLRESRSRRSSSFRTNRRMPSRPGETLSTRSWR